MYSFQVNHIDFIIFKTSVELCLCILLKKFYSTENFSQTDDTHTLVIYRNQILYVYKMNEYELIYEFSFLPTVEVIGDIFCV